METEAELAGRRAAMAYASLARDVRLIKFEAVADAAREVFMSVEWCNGVYVGGNASPREWRVLGTALSKLDKEE